MDADVVLPTGSEVKLYVTSEKAEGVMTIPVDAVIMKMANLMCIHIQTEKYGRNLLKREF